MFEHDQDAVVERFRATNGRFSGVLGLVFVVVVLVLDLESWDTGTPLGIAIGAALCGVVVWAALLRPAVWVTGRDLVLRGIFHTDRVPLAAIDRVAVTHVLTVVAGERRFVSPVVGHPMRRIVKGRRNQGVQRTSTDRTGFAVPEPRITAPAEASSPQAFTEARLQFLAQDARDRAGIRTGSPEQAALVAEARRTWAWPEIVASGVLAIALVVWFLT